MLVKYLQYYGGAIVSGYFPNPILNNIPYDSGSCASALYSDEIIKYFNIDKYKELNKLNYSLNVPGVQLFFNPNDLKHPLEYEINPVDEKVNLYSKLENLFDILSPEDYDKFINESFIIFEKYKTQCNPNNTKLILLTNKCNGKFENTLYENTQNNRIWLNSSKFYIIVINYTYSGYKYGNDGYWTEECVPSYCDFGYIFDYNSNKCIIDVCYEEEKGPEPKPKPNSESESESNFMIKDYIFLIFIIIICILVIIIIILSYLYIKEKKLRKTIGINSVENINIVEGMITKGNN